MKLARTLRDDEVRADMTPMIDVVFQLLIFFLCNLHYRALEGRLDAFLPRDLGRASQAEHQRTTVEVAILVAEPGERRDPADLEQAWSGSGRYELVGRRVTYHVGPRATTDLAEVTRLLGELRREDAGRNVVLAPRAGAIYDDVVPVLDAALAAGYEDVTFRGG